jgi:parallel beta-helix repeat protein
MELRSITTGITALVAALLFVSAASAQDAIVPDDFGSIQAAVLGAGDTDGDGTVEIFVRNGTYNENLLIQRSNLELTGENPRQTVIQGAAAPPAVVYVQNASNVTIQGFKVQGGGAAADGIQFTRVTDSLIFECWSRGNRDGFSLGRSDRNTVRRCLTENNAMEGVKLRLSNDCTVNKVVVRNNGEEGVQMTGTMRTVVQNCRLRGNFTGYDVDRSQDCMVLGGFATGHVNSGVRIRESDGTLVQGVRSDGNENGIRMEDSMNSLVTMNAFLNNREWGIRMENSTNDDFSSDAGINPPPGDNDVSGNLFGPVRID